MANKSRLRMNQADFVEELKKGERQIKIVRSPF